ncbi:MAG TPA: zf-HC2 domain-containing protein [Pyrinomonadaceae bacterium]|jgi:anti-sigma factor RsiW
MSEKTYAAPPPRGCERGEELVAYLYGEATKEEAGLFRGHLEACAACREEFTALGGVREGLSAWRAEALGTVPPLNIEEALAPAARANAPAPRERSARAALREFFSLSPLWLRAGALAATLAVCALAALTLARAEVHFGPDGLALRAGVTEKVVTEQAAVPTQVGYTAEQVNAVVAQKVAEAKAQFVAETERQNDRRPEQVVNVTAAVRNSQRAPDPSGARRKRAPRRAPGRDDSLLAEDNLPSLSDLLSGSY